MGFRDTKFQYYLSVPVSRVPGFLCLWGFIPSPGSRSFWFFFACVFFPNFDMQKCSKLSTVGFVHAFALLSEMSQPPSRKRTRVADELMAEEGGGGGGSGGGSSSRRGAAIGAKINARFPYADYGRIYVRRGTDSNLERFGATYRQANEEQRAARRDSGYYGRGLYKGRGGYWAQTLGGSKGGFWDRLEDAITPIVPGGSLISKGAETLHRAMRGRGVYTTNDTIQGSGSAFSAPRFTERTDGGTGVVISHREYVCDVYGPDVTSLPFENQVFPINPGMERTFPWLSQVACNYEEYELLQCIFTYKSTTTDIGSSTTGQCGTVVAATQYDVSDEPFSDKESMLRYALSASCKTTDNLLHGVECDPSKLSGAPGKYIRNTPVLLNQDAKDYDHGVFNLALANIPAAYANQSLGELWISYTVRLRKPKIVSAKAYNIERSVFASGGSSVSSTANPIFVGLLNDLGATSPFLSGQQNSLDVLVQPGLPAPGGAPPAPYSVNYVWANMCSFTLPSYYGGNLEILVKMDFPSLVTPTVTTGAALGPMGFQMTGNIRLINDIPVRDTVAGPTSWVAYSQALCNPQQPAIVTQYIFRLHVDVGIATGGVDNVISLYPSYLASQSPVPCILGCTVEFSEYNTVLNYRQDGKDDRWMLTDTTGQLVMY